MNKKMLIIPAALVALVLTTASACPDTKEDASFSCNDVTTSTDGAPVKNCMAPSKLKVFLMPDGFRNVAFGCNGKVGIYVTSRGWVENGSGDLPSLPSSISTVENDPNCP